MGEDPEAIDMGSNERLSLDGDDDEYDRTCSKSRSSKKNGHSKLVIERVKGMVKFIVSVCVLCLGLALSFSLFSPFPHSFSVYFSTFLFSLLNHALERKYMFLICNGILFLLATSSLIIQDSSSSSNYSSSFGTCYYSFNSHSHDHHFQPPHPHLVPAINEEQNQEVEEEEEMNRGEEEEEEEEEEMNRGELEEEDEDEGCFTEEVEEEEEEEGKRRELEVVVSTEELNKKIEAFIRKMKEEMRIEAAQTQLIAV